LQTYRAINSTNIRHAGRDTTARRHAGQHYIQKGQAWLNCCHIRHTAVNQPHQLNPVNIHQMARPADIRQSSLLLNLSTLKGWKAELPSWLTYSGRLTHISGHPSATGRAWDRESLPVKDQHSTTVQRNQRLYVNMHVHVHADRMISDSTLLVGQSVSSL